MNRLEQIASIVYGIQIVHDSIGILYYINRRYAKYIRIKLIS